MNIFSSFFRKKTLGIDISDFSIEVLAINRSGNVVAHAREILPAGLVEKGEIKNVERVAEVLKKTIGRADSAHKEDDGGVIYPRRTAESGAEQTPVVVIGEPVAAQAMSKSARIAFPKNKTYISQFQYNMENATRKDIEKAIQKEISKVFPNFPEGFVWDYVVTTPGKDKFTNPAGLYAFADEKVSQSYADVMGMAEDIGSAISDTMIFGIDMSDFAVDIMSFNKSGKILFRIREMIPGGLIMQGEIKDVDKIAGIIKKVISKASAASKEEEEEKTAGGGVKPKTASYKSARIAFPKNKTYISQFQYNMENATRKDIEKAIQKEISKVFPNFPEGFVWDYVVTTPGKDKFTNPAGLYAFADEKVSQSYADVMRRAGMEDFYFELEPVALGRALLEDAAGKVAYTLITDIGANTTSFYVFSSKGELELASNIDVGGEEITSQIAERKGLSLERAESIKKRTGLTTDDFKKIITEVLSPVEKEMKFFMNRYSRLEAGDIKQVILAGGTSLLPGLDRYLNEVLLIDVYVGDPFRKIKNPNRAFADSAAPILFANVIGLGLAGIIGKYAAENINLAPRSAVEAEKLSASGRRVSLLLILNAILLVVLLLVAIFRK